MREATIAQRSSVQSSSCYSVHFESADSFVMRRRPSLARIGLFYSLYNANSVRANAQKAPRETFSFFVCLFVPRADRKQPRGGTGLHAGETMSRYAAQMHLSSRLSPLQTANARPPRLGTAQSIPAHRRSCPRGHS